jgi:2-keto-3-deoxy-galactonokinase
VRDALEAARADAEARPPAVIARGHVPGRSGWIAVPRGAEPA